MNEKLHKLLAKSGYGSRRDIEELIRQKRISIDGNIAPIGARVDSKSSIIRIDGRIVKIVNEDEEICRVIAYNKPEGQISTLKDKNGRPSVFDRLPRLDKGRWIAVGRLDINTAGLLLFTNDGELSNGLLQPNQKIEKEYMVRVFGNIDESKIRNLVNGIKIDGEVLRFEDVVYAGGEGMNHTFYVMIRDGKNKSVKLLWESQELTVSRIKRVRFGEIFLTKDMPKGAWKELDLKSINYLRELVGLPQEKNTLIVPDLKRGKSKVQKIKKAVRRYENKLIKDSNSFKSSTRSKLRHKK